MARRRHKKILSYTLVILACLVVIGSCASYYLSRHYRRIIMAHLPAWAAAASDSLYKVSVGNISINILNRRVKVKDVHIYPDTQHLRRLQERGGAPPITFDIRVPQIRVQGVLWEALILEKELSCQLFSVRNPRILVRNQPAAAAAPVAAPPHRGAAAPQEMALSRLVANRLEVINAEVSYLHLGDHDSFYCNTQNGNIVFDDWELNPGKPADPARFLYGRSASIALSCFLFYKPGSLYLMRSDSLTFTSADSQARFRNLQIRPVVAAEDFSRKVGYQKDRYEVTFGTCALQRLDWHALLDGTRLDADVLRLDQPDINIYMDRRLPPGFENKLGRFPHQLLLRLPMPLHIDSALVTEGKFRYTELSEKTKREGIILFEDIGGTILNLTNEPAVIRQRPEMRASFNAMFMRSSPLDASFVFRLDDPAGGAFSLDAVLRQVESSQLREAAKALAAADISSLRVPSLVFHLQGNEQEARGDFEFLYHNLKVRIQSIDGATNRMSNRPFVSLLANTVLLYPDNPMKGEAVRRVSVVQVRDPYKSFFNLIWKSIFQALGKTALRGEEALNMVREQQERRAGKAERKAAREERKRLRKERREERAQRKAAREAVKRQP